MQKCNYSTFLEIGWSVQWRQWELPTVSTRFLTNTKTYERQAFSENITQAHPLKSRITQAHNQEGNRAVEALKFSKTC